MPADIQYFCVCHGFPIWAPALLFISPNGIFYAHNFRLPGAPPRVAVAAGDIGYEGAVALGSNLMVVLRATTNIADELYH